MLGWCALARKAQLSPDVARAIDSIVNAMPRYKRLVDDLIDATRIHAGSLHLDLAPVTLDLPVLAAIEAVKPVADAQQLQLRYTCPAPSPVVNGDASRLQQIASNLLVNAVKFTPDGKSIDVTN